MSRGTLSSASSEDSSPVVSKRRRSKTIQACSSSSEDIPLPKRRRTSQRIAKRPRVVLDYSSDSSVTPPVSPISSIRITPDRGEHDTPSVKVVPRRTSPRYRTPVLGRSSSRMLDDFATSGTDSELEIEDEDLEHGELDEITKEPLESPHICYRPDNAPVLCFNLSTLRNLALTDYHDGKPIMWKQPPHFYNPMSSDMIEQIRRKFGDSELKLTRPLNIGRYGMDFADQFGTWIRSRMGSSDVYLCPICYTWKWKDGIEPLENIMEGVAGDTGKAASIMFHRLTEVKRHLSKKHNVRVGDVRDAEFFHRYQFRKADGILQTYIGSTFLEEDLRQGMMRDYWMNRCSYRARVYNTLVDHMGGPDQFTRAKYNKDSQETWEQIAGPYMDDDIDDFIAGSESESPEELEEEFESSEDEEDIRNMRYDRDMDEAEAEVRRLEAEALLADCAGDYTESDDPSEEELEEPEGEFMHQTPRTRKAQLLSSDDDD